MEWIRISTHKLKIMLSAEDARRYALDPEKADYADVMTRDAFREILTDVQKETGFETGDDKIYIQMYPSKEGGCELFVTRMGLAYHEDTPRATLAAAEPPKNAKSPRTVRKKTGAFRFDELEHLLALCRCISGHFPGESEIWKDELGRWWLILTEGTDPRRTGADFRLVREYGHVENAENARVFLPEHAKRICAPNAVSVFGEF